MRPHEPHKAEESHDLWRDEQWRDMHICGACGAPYTLQPAMTLPSCPPCLSHLRRFKAKRKATKKKAPR